MIQPSVTICDFCENPIHDGEQVITIELPVQETLRREILAYISAEVLPRMATSPLSAMIGPDALVPKTWTIQSCAPCAFAILPDVLGKVARQIRAAINRALAAKRRATESLAELDEARP